MFRFDVKDCSVALSLTGVPIHRPLCLLNHEAHLLLNLYGEMIALEKLESIQMVGNCDIGVHLVKKLGKRVFSGSQNSVYVIITQMNGQLCHRLAYLLVLETGLIARHSRTTSDSAFAVFAHSFQRSRVTLFDDSFVIVSLWRKNKVKNKLKYELGRGKVNNRQSGALAMVHSFIDIVYELVD